MNENGPITNILAGYAITLKKDGIPSSVKEKALESFTDAYFCTLAGVFENATAITRKYSLKQNKTPEATMVGTGLKCGYCEAARINGVALAVHELDDINNRSMGHPSAPVLPTVLALGEKYDLSGSDILDAYIIGIEIYSLMGWLFTPEHNRRGWNPSGSLGIFGATAAAAVLLDLDENSFATALAIAASDSSGLKGNAGTMTKPLHSARASEKGIFATEMARSGFTANREIFEAGGGFAEATADGCIHKDKMLDAIKNRNSEFLDMGITMKPWASCRATHNAIDAILRIQEEENFAPEDIAAIEITILPAFRDIVKYGIVDDPAKGKFSFHYCAALAFANREIRMNDFEPGTEMSPVIIDLMNKTTVVTDYSGPYFDGYGKTVVKISTVSGRACIKSITYAKGDPKNPMTKEEHFKKYYDCMARNFNPGNTKDLVEMLGHLPERKSIRKFMACTEELLRR